MLDTVKVIVSKALISSMLAVLLLAGFGALGNTPVYFLIVGVAVAIEAGIWLWNHKYRR